MKKWFIYLAFLFAAIAFSVLIYFKLGQERFLHLLNKYGLEAGLISGVIVILIAAGYFGLKYIRRKKKEREEALRIDLKDLRDLF